MGRIREVRKRDNRIVPFDETKIADAIYAAFRSVGEGERSAAAELASAVTHFLEEKFAGTVPGIEDIQDVVETVLIEMGQTKVAKAYILYRQKRAMLRETLKVRKEPPSSGADAEYLGADDEPGRGGEADSQLLPEVDQGLEGVSSWQKSKIAAALIREADIDPSVAEDVASSVERKVLDSGIKRISTSLIRELVDNELFDRGFSAKLQKQVSISVPKYNLEQIIFGTDVKEGFAYPKTPLEIRNIVANRILHQYSLQEVFTPSVANAHNDGRIFIHRLSDPIRLSRLRWPLGPPGAQRAASVGQPLESFRDAPAAYLDLGDFFRKLWHLAHFFSEEIWISGLDNFLLDPSSRSLSAAEKARLVLERLSQMDARPDIALEFDLAPEALPWVEGLAGLSRVVPRRFRLAFRLRASAFRMGSGEAVLKGVAELFERGERVEFLPPAAWNGRWAAGEARGEGSPPEGPRQEVLPLSAEVGKITVNLPRAAFRSGRDRRASMETEIDSLLDLVIKGHLERRRFVERLGANRENPLWELAGGSGERPLIGKDDMVFGVGLLGLNECVKYLAGSELHQDPAAARIGLEIVREIHRKLRREERSLGVRLVLEETANVGPLRLLERADRRRCPQIHEIDKGRNPEWGGSYTSGVRLHRLAPVDPLRRIEELSPYLRHLEPTGGVVEDFPELRASAGDLLVSLLEECLPTLGEAAPGGAKGRPMGGGLHAVTVAQTGGSRAEERQALPRGPSLSPRNKRGREEKG